MGLGFEFLLVKVYMLSTRILFYQKSELALGDMHENNNAYIYQLNVRCKGCVKAFLQRWNHQPDI